MRNARLTLTAICAALGTLLIGIGYLASHYRVGAMRQEEADYQSVISQLVGAIVGGFLFSMFGAQGVDGVNIYSMFVAVMETQGATP